MRVDVQEKMRLISVCVVCILIRVGLLYLQLQIKELKECFPRSLQRQSL